MGPINCGVQIDCDTSGSEEFDDDVAILRKINSVCLLVPHCQRIPQRVGVALEQKEKK